MRSNLKAVGLACIILSFFGAVLASIGEDSPPAAAQSNQPGHLLAPASVLAGQQPLTPTPGASGNRPQGIIIITNTPTRTPTPINIGNFVWDDINQDGNQDAGEAGVPNVTVELYGTQGLIDSTVTNASGLYSLTAPTPGDYRVRVRLPSILDHFTAKDQGDDLKDSDINPSGLNTGYTDVFTLASNVISITKIDAGIVVYRPPTATRTPTPINIGNFVWRDSNSNGVQDSGEPGVPNVTVELWDSAKQTRIDSAVTNANGLYSLTAPTPGDYRVRVVLPGAGAFSPKDQGGDDLKDSDANPTGINLGFTDTFTLASNVISITKIDIGLVNLPAVLPTLTPSPTLTPTATSGATLTPTATSSATLTPTAMSSATLTPTVLPSAQPMPSSLYLPLIVK